MQDHKQMQALLVTYDELDGPTRQQVDDHLATCPACAATLAAYQQSDHLLRAWLTQKEMSLREQPSWSSVTPPMWVQRTRPRQRAAWRDPRAFRLSRLRPPLSQVAWAGLLLLLLGLLLFSFSGWLPIAEPVRAATPTVVTATAEAPAIQTTPVVTGEKTTIRFAVHRWGEANFLQLIREFEAANPDLEDVLTSYPTGVSYPKPGWTLHEFVEPAKALTSHDGNPVTRWRFVENRYAPLTMIESQVVAEHALAIPPTPAVTVTPVPTTDVAIENCATVTYTVSFGRADPYVLRRLATQTELLYPTIPVHTPDPVPMSGDIARCCSVWMANVIQRPFLPSAVAFSNASQT